jgi:NAD(P)-dependent dehydrogenase (short-subunit alcohol dehydrogenase family)
LTILIASLPKFKREKGRLHVVIANAGIAKYARLGTITEAFCVSIFRINVKRVVFTVQKAVPLLSDGASIVLNSSIVGSKGLSSNGIYSGTKAAIHSFARTWTTDLKDQHIQVNAISPGSIDVTDLVTSSITSGRRSVRSDLNLASS